MKQQHLAEPLQKELLKLVNREANKEWANNSENGKLIEINREKVEPLSAGVWNFVRQLLP